MASLEGGVGKGLPKARGSRRNANFLKKKLRPVLCHATVKGLSIRNFVVPSAIWLQFEKGKGLGGETLTLLKATKF